MQISPERRFNQRYATSILAMILGNAMNRACLRLECLLSGAARERVTIGAQLVLCVVASQAMRLLVRDALRA